MGKMMKDVNLASRRRGVERETTVGVAWVQISAPPLA